ncbi:MAG: enoyl-CoA hydratase/isomerase family protein [Saprospiraceae bacterium]|nr:enoyl-CoA hydratase/isomerase family protein [Saprospiraceae bacterium]
MQNLGHVRTQVHNGIATIEFFHPAQNSLPSNLLTQLTLAIKVVGNDPSVSVVVLRSGGERTFCAGASFDELAAITDFETGKRFFSGFANVINAMRTCPKFIIVRAQGKAVGGGVGICSAADYCIASHYATIKLSELTVGFGPFVIGPAVERRMGLSAFSELAINASEWRTADWAKEKGLYNEVFDTIEQVDAYVAHLAEKLTASSPEAMRELKRVLWQDTENWSELLDERAAISGRLALSDFTKQAIAAFKKT